MELLGEYQNGNIVTKIYDDGTLYLETPNNEPFKPAFARSIDIKITNNCDVNCPYCHEGSYEHGTHADIMNAKFIDTLHPYQEVALGGGNVLSHPDLLPFLKKLKELKVIANITVNQVHFEQNCGYIQELSNKKLVYGIGVSLNNATDAFVEKVQRVPNTMIHVINGIFIKEQAERLADRDLKLLVLGYKDLKRGMWYQLHERDKINYNQEWLKISWIDLLPRFKVMSFDNLAIEQLCVKSHLTDKQWNDLYMGDEGISTFYIDMVNQQFAYSSTALWYSRYYLIDSVDEMFNIVKGDL